MPAPLSRKPTPACTDMTEGPTIFQRRIVVGAAICVAAFALVLVRLVDVTLLQNGVHRSARGFSEQVRADMLDRNGEILARDIPTEDLYARPHVFDDKAQAARDLAAATGTDANRLTTMMTGKHPYVL